jgi:putative methyltransferase
LFNSLLPQKDPQRLARLRANIAAMGASCVAPQLADFLTIDPEAPAYRNVQAVLLDPSCSGSGTAYTRMDYLLPSAANILKGGLAMAGATTNVWQHWDI